MKLRTLASILAVATSATFAQATLVFSDSFNYTVGQNLESQTGWSGLNSGTPPAIVSGNLTVPGLAASSGNMVSWTTGNIKEALGGFTAQTTGQIFYSFAFRMDQLPTAEAYSFALSHSNTLYGAAVWLRANGTQFEIGLSNRSNSTANYASTLFDVGTTYFLVGSYNLDDKTSSLWLTPASNTFGLSAPAATLTASGGTAMTTISQFLIRGTTGSPAMTMDELRIGTTWASVTAIPEPSTYAAIAGVLALGLALWHRRREA
jgi:hypothetical protein